jgi:hypothetical protein
MPHRGAWGATMASVDRRLRCTLVDHDAQTNPRYIAGAARAPEWRSGAHRPR